MNTPQLKQFYTDRIQKFTEELQPLQKQLSQSSIFRILIFLMMPVIGWFLYPDWNIMVPTMLVNLAGFVFLVKRHTKLLAKKAQLQALIQVNQTEIDVLDGIYDGLANGDDYKTETHLYTHDIDIFGYKSIFQYTNRTASENGKSKLALLFASNDIENIPQKQAVVKELGEKVDWRHKFQATGHLVKASMDIQTILQWMQDRSNFVPGLMKILPNLLFGLSIITLVLMAFGFVPLWSIVIFIAIGLAITGNYKKKIEILYSSVGHMTQTISQYQQLIALLETESFESELAIAQKRRLTKDKALGIESNPKEKSASELFAEFSRIVDAFDQRNNAFVGLFGNALALWDLRQAWKLERWINQNQDKMSDWFDAIAWFDAYNSLGNYSFNHTDYVFPAISNSKFGKDDSASIQFTGIAHPLIRPEKRVPNDFNIENRAFHIVTGANMAGKSTFLRTVGISIVQANMGLPLCAKQATYSPIKLISSMRTTDSLTEDESYFYAELKRLKTIVEQINGQSYFILLDEILKGTNSEDKAQGSWRFIEKILLTQSSGIIATHDLSICKISDIHPQVSNYYFDAEITNDELHFDYTKKEGVCQNMNASFLLRKMGIA